MERKSCRQEKQVKYNEIIFKHIKRVYKYMNYTSEKKFYLCIICKRIFYQVITKIISRRTLYIPFVYLEICLFSNSNTIIMRLTTNKIPKRLTLTVKKRFI